MKFTEVKTLDHLLKQLKEYATPVGQQSTNNTGIGSNAKSQGRISKAMGDAGGMAKSMAKSMVRGKDSKLTQKIKSVAGGVQGTATSIANPGSAEKTNAFKPALVKDLEKDTEIFDKEGKALGTIDSPLGDDKFGGADAIAVLNKKGEYEIKQPDDETFIAQTNEGKLSKLANRKNKKLKLRKLKGKIKKLSRKKLKEADPKLFEINFNQTSIAKEALDAPVKCGFEAETFFYNVDSSSSSDDVDNMSVTDIEYEYGDLPDSAYEDFNTWLYEKGQEEFLDELIDEKIEEVKEDEEYLNDFIDSSNGPSSEAVERYKNNFEEEDPKEYENREEDGWEYINWVREYVEEEYEEEYLDWLREDVVSEYDLGDDAKELAEENYGMDDFVEDNYTYMSSFLDDYGYDYSRPTDDVEGVAERLHDGWITTNSNYTSYPETGDYGETNTTTAWSVESDSSIEPDDGAGAELISPVFDSPRAMMTEMKSLFDWSEKEFGTNRSTGLHVTMSWHGKSPDTVKDEDDEFYGWEGTGPNKLKMALLLGDEYLLAEFGRLKNSYTKSQYNNVLKHAEGMKRGEAKSFKAFEKELAKGIDTGKFNSIHFKNEKDRIAGTNLVEFRIAGGEDYNTMYEKVVKAVVRYSTIMKAGYDESAFRKDYVNAVFRLLRKSQEIDPRKLKDLEVVNHEVIDAAKSIVGKKDYFDVIKLLSTSVEYLQNYEKLSEPNADKEWKQSIKDYEKGTGSKFDVSEAEVREPIQGYMEPNSMAPSKRAAGELKKAQDRFGSAATLLARDIADGNNRASVSAKHIGAFRKFAKELKLNTDTIEKLAFSSMDTSNFDGSDKEKVARLQKGINTLFKQDIIKKPDFLSPQYMDSIASKMWQFYQSDDAKDNVKLDKLADLLVNLNPSNNKDEVIGSLKELTHERQQNGFSAKLKGSGWNNNTTLMGTGKITTPGASAELLKFLEPYSGYKHPTGRQHHINIKSDDSYASVFDMRLRQRLRERLEHITELEMDDPEKATILQQKLAKVGIELLEGLKPRPDLWDRDDDGHASITRGSDGEADLATHSDLERWNNAMDRVVRLESELTSSDKTYNFSSAYDDYILGSIHLDKYYSWKERNGPVQSAVLRNLHKERFASIKKFLSEFDKVFRKEGFLDLKAEIQAKNTLDRRNRDFEKNVRDNAKAKLNIPDHSWVYIDKEFFDTITDETYGDRAAYLDNHLDNFNKNINNTKVYVIPSSHWTDAEDAVNGLDLIDTFEKSKNYFHSWRKSNYRRINNRFQRKYGYSWGDLTDGEKFYSGDGDLYSKLKKLGIEITRQGDSRKGAPGQDDLIDAEETKNISSGEPLNRSSAINWSMNSDDSEQKRFDAFDWSLYPEKMKSVVAKMMKNTNQSNGNFQTALDNVLQKVVDREIDLDITKNDDASPPRDDVTQTGAGYDSPPNDVASRLNNPIPDGQEYDKARADHPGFDSMMRIGMQRYLARGEVNDLVGFLNNPSNDNVFKSHVLNTIANRADLENGPFASFQDALAVTRRQGNESVFTKFDKLSLQEQLTYLEKIDKKKIDKVHEGRLKNAWMAGDYKEPVEPTLAPNPMRIKKKYDPAEHRENVIKSIMSKQNISRANATMQVNAMVKRDPNYFTDKSKVDESVPNNTTIRVLNTLLAEPMPAHDIKKQMDAYFAIPVPQMLKDFRYRAVEGGPEICLRSILRNYIQQNLNPRLHTELNLTESKDDLIAKLSDLPDDEATKKLVNYIEQLIDDMGVGGKIQSLSSQLEIIPDVDVKKAVNQIAKIIASIEMSPTERAQLFVDWKADKIVNVDALLSTSTVSLETIFNGYGDKGESHITELVDDLNQVVQYGIGPGEFALAVLSQRIEGIGASSGDNEDGEGEGKGDLLIDKSPIELKTTRKNSARFNDRQVVASDSYKTMVTAFFTKYDEKFKELEAQGLKVRVKSGMQQGHVINFLKAVPEAEKEVAEIISNIFTALPISGGPIARFLAQGDKNQAMQLIAQSNVNNYLTHKRGSGNLAGILFLDLNKQAFTFIKEVSDLEGTGLRLHAKTNYLITTSENPFANTSIVDTGA